MAEILTHTNHVDAREERRIREVMPQALEALISILNEGTIEANTGQIDQRIKILPSYKVYKPVGNVVLSNVLNRLVDAGEAIVAERESLDTNGKPQRQKFYKRPEQTEIPQN